MPDDDAFLWDSPTRPPAPPPRPQPPPVGPRAVAEESGPAVGTEREAILVPVDEWSRILRQLGHVHESGQQLAEARERAARAETEATFLRDRLKELRERLEAAEAVPEPPPEPEPSFGEWLLRRWVQRRRDG